MLIPEQYRHLHFVGIGGSGMSGLAEIFHNMGFRVQGSDLHVTDVTRRLEKLGIQIFYGHDAQHLGNAQAVVVSTAIPEDNPELVESRSRGIPLIPRAAMLAELMRMKYAIAVSGAHGKTTTTSMIGHMLHVMGLDPTTLVGGRLLGYDSGARAGESRYLVAEADESDRSFLYLYPTVAVATNIDREHLNTYRSVLKIQEAFLDFLNRVPFYGAAVVGIDNLYLRDLLPELRGRKLTFGFSPDAHLRAEDIQTDGRSVTFRLVQDQQPRTRVYLPIPGKHNVLNALAALCVAEVLHLDLVEAARALKTFRGVARRFEIRAEGEDWVWVDDYGHHPTEIAAVLETARAFWSGKILTVFQPHRYTRTRDLWREFGEVLGNTDELVLLPVYPAGETPIPGVSSQLIEASLRRAHPQLPYHMAESLEDAVQWIRERGLRHTLLLTLGAGNVWQVGERVVRS